MTDLSRSITVKPIIKYPREAQVGKTYLMTIDLQPEDGFEWYYDGEEYPVYCSVDSELLTSKPVGEPVVVLHRFGGSYGEAKFLLTSSSSLKQRGRITVSLTNKWGVQVQLLRLEGIQVTRNTYTPYELNEYVKRMIQAISSHELQKEDLKLDKLGSPSNPILIVISNPVDIKKKMFCEGIFSTEHNFTCVPQKLLKSVKAQVVGRALRFQIFEELTNVTPYVISIICNETLIEGIEVWSWDKDFALIGLDLLGKFRVES